MLKLSTEIKLHIFAGYCTPPADRTHTLCNVRLTCKDLHGSATDAFLTAYFTTLLVNSTSESMARLVEIAGHPVIQKRVRAVFLSSAALPRKIVPLSVLASALSLLPNCRQIGTTAVTEGSLCWRSALLPRLDWVTHVNNPNRFMLTAANAGGIVRPESVSLDAMEAGTRTSSLIRAVGQEFVTSTLLHMHVRIGEGDHPGAVSKELAQFTRLTHLSIGERCPPTSACEHAVNRFLQEVRVPTLRTMVIQDTMQSEGIIAFMNNHNALQELTLIGVSFLRPREWRTLFPILGRLSRMDVRRVGTWLPEEREGEGNTEDDSYHVGWEEHTTIRKNIECEMTAILKGMQRMPWHLSHSIDR